STDLVTSLDNGLNYAASLTNPFPGGFLLPPGSSGGLATNLGQGISFFDENTTSSYMQRWQLALQRQLTAGTLIEVSYVGNRATRMQVGRDLNPTPVRYLSTLPTRDQATIDFLSAQVANPFYPLLPKTNLASTAVSRSQLLKPYPQFSGVSVTQNVGYSWYHSLQVRVEKRFSKGLNASMSYTWSKTMEALSYLNAPELGLEGVISTKERTFPSRFSGNRADGPNYWDMSVIKNIRLSERTQLQFRAEAINALNHPQFTAPNTTTTSTAFGTVTGEFARPRVIQFGLKALF